MRAVTKRGSPWQSGHITGGFHPAAKGGVASAAGLTYHGRIEFCQPIFAATGTHPTSGLTAQSPRWQPAMD